MGESKVFLIWVFVAPSIVNAEVFTQGAQSSGGVEGIDMAGKSVEGVFNNVEVATDYIRVRKLEVIPGSIQGIPEFGILRRDIGGVDVQDAESGRGMPGVFE